MREQRQEEAVEAFMETDHRSIINACPRFGKIKVAIEIMIRMTAIRVLILAPRKDIYKGWLDDFAKFYIGRVAFATGAEFQTFASIKKLKKGNWDLIIIDEPHELSVNQQNMLEPIARDYPVLGLTGTLTQKTRNELYDNLNLDVCYKYTIEQGVEEGILADYQMFIHQVPLDNVVRCYGKNNSHTEKGFFNVCKKVRNSTDNPLSQHFITLRMINVIQNSKAKAKETMKLIETHKNERILVFCGVTKVADNLGVPVYHSKAREKQIFLDFCAGTGMHLATIKMMQAGITVLPINLGIINYMSGNPEDSAQKICRFLGLEYANPDKKAEIHIISTDEEFELSRLKTGLAFFDESKIHHITT